MGPDEGRFIFGRRKTVKRLARMRSRVDDDTYMPEPDQGLDARAEAELRRLAYRDHLTGLPNRIAMSDRIEAAMARSRREGTCAALVFVDMDGFKLVNDTLGHAAGDELLRLVGDRLRRLGDARVTAGRHGGDEFLLLVEDLPPGPYVASQSLQAIGRRLLNVLHEPFTVARSSFEIGASAGGSIFPIDAETHHELVDHADQAMYMAKRHGGARMVLFDEPESHSVLELETTLRARRALTSGELELYYQPVLEIADGRGLGGLEALLRWRDPDRGLLLPDAFLPFIEHSPLVEEISEWVFEEICCQLARWTERGFSPRISFNIPARQLRWPAFAEFVISTAEQYGADPRRLAAEITESSPVALEEVLPTLLLLREAGFALSLDDFGTGYSSLARLRSMPFTLLKTDRSFMTGIPGDQVAAELLEGIISLGKTLGMTVIVEGVETAAQEQELLGLGCRVAQGYHLGPPAAPDEIEAQWAPVRSAGRR
jgi:diguanylate cyclase (GGDEF)-like protein